MNKRHLDILFQIFSRKVRPEEIEKVFSLRHDPAALDPAPVIDLLHQRSDEDHEHEDRLPRSDVEPRKR